MTTNRNWFTIIENEKDMPKINLNNPKIKFYEFTHDKNVVRYDFLLDYID